MQQRTFQHCMIKQDEIKLQNEIKIQKIQFLEPEKKMNTKIKYPIGEREGDKVSINQEQMQSKLRGESEWKRRLQNGRKGLIKRKLTHSRSLPTLASISYFFAENNISRNQGTTLMWKKAV